MPDQTDLPDNPPSDITALPEAVAQPAPDAQPPAPSVADGADTTDAATAAVADETSAEASADEPADSADTTPAAPGAPALPLLAPAAAAELLRQHFPALFAGPARPLKLRIQQDIQQRAPGVFSRGTLSAFFRRHTGSTGYLISLTKASHRFDLDGQPAGELSDEHKQAAQAELTRRRQLTREREQAAQAQQREQQREAQKAEMAQQAEQMQARQARFALLRDFQRTTLTLANFCALKGMTPETLNPLLEQAKQEAAEAPPVAPRPFDDRRGPGPRRDDRRPPGRDGAPSARADGGPRGDRGPRGPGGPAADRGPRGQASDRRPRGPGRQGGGNGAGGAGGTGGTGGPPTQS